MSAWICGKKASCIAILNGNAYSMDEKRPSSIVISKGDKTKCCIYIKQNIFRTLLTMYNVYF